MLFDRVILAWASQAGMSDRLLALRACGYDVQVLSTPEEVAIRGKQRAPGVFTPVLLQASGPDARATVAWLRAQLPRACLVAMVQTADEGERLALLRMGVNWICGPDESVDLVGEALLALWRQHLGDVPDARVKTHQGWTLRGYAWTLEGPCGRRISLSVGERAVLTALFNSPGLTARYPELRAALDVAYSHLDDERRPARDLGIVVSRLRAKGRRAGLSIPIYAVYGQRYIFEPAESCPITGQSEGTPGSPVSDKSGALISGRRSSGDELALMQQPVYQAGELGMVSGQFRWPPVPPNSDRF